MNPEPKSVQRVIGFDSHPDSFTAAVVSGPTPAAAIVEKVCDHIPMAQLQSWAQKQTREHDLFVLESSGNSFQIVRALAEVGRQALVLESCHLGKLKEAHANNDKISAIRIAKAWLAGTARTVWVPDATTQERRDWFHAHRKSQQRTTQLKNRLRSYLSDRGVRLKKGTRLTQVKALAEQIKQARSWSAREWQVVEILMVELEQAETQRLRWRSLIAQEVLADPALLALVRVCGIGEMTAFALGAFVGDIRRFAAPKKLVKYIGLNPAFDHSGKGEWTGGIGGHGRTDLRCLLIEGAHSILRGAQNSLAKWGKMLLARKGQLHIAVAAVARKLAVAAWYVMMGRTPPTEEVGPRMAIKVSKLITSVGTEGLKKLGKNRKAFKEEIHQRLKTGKVYLLLPTPPRTA